VSIPDHLQWARYAGFHLSRAVRYERMGNVRVRDHATEVRAPAAARVERYWVHRFRLQATGTPVKEASAAAKVAVWGPEG